MTLQTRAHPKLRPDFENGVRRCDVNAAIDLFVEVLDCYVAPVADFYAFAIAIGFTEVTEPQMRRVLSQRADRGELLQITHKGKYLYGSAARDGAPVKLR